MAAMWEASSCQLIFVLIPSAANMKVITSIYLNCRPDLRDEWLTGTEVDDVGDAQVRFSIGILYINTHRLLGPRASSATSGQIL
jgi:hypothetical protein